MGNSIEKTPRQVDLLDAEDLNIDEREPNVSWLNEGSVVPRFPKGNIIPFPEFDVANVQNGFSYVKDTIRKISCGNKSVQVDESPDNIIQRPVPEWKEGQSHQTPGCGGLQKLNGIDLTTKLGLKDTESNACNEASEATRMLLKVVTLLWANSAGRPEAGEIHKWMRRRLKKFAQKMCHIVGQLFYLLLKSFILHPFLLFCQTICLAISAIGAYAKPAGPVIEKIYQVVTASMSQSITLECFYNSDGGAAWDAYKFGELTPIHISTRDDLGGNRDVYQLETDGMGQYNLKVLVQENLTYVCVDGYTAEPIRNVTVILGDDNSTCASSTTLMGVTSSSSTTFIGVTSSSSPTWIGVIGGIVGLIAIASFLAYCLRKKYRKFRDRTQRHSGQTGGQSEEIKLLSNKPQTVDNDKEDIPNGVGTKQPQAAESAKEDIPNGVGTKQPQAADNAKEDIPNGVVAKQLPAADNAEEDIPYGLA